ncbi:unnamed protein product [Rotaria socialis]|uniref:Uncharacterized protein n=1 Tax=Rotaria socialis TaxID=392032 RepID=A0A821FJ33_9BILA|nr:unnamed protein product [Rotaria socialis]CAF4652064.1 unnamed protein product [Rotaria socialis]
MTTKAGTSQLLNDKDHGKISTSQVIDDMAGSTLVNMPAGMKDGHPNSLVSFPQDAAQRMRNPKEDFLKFSTSLLKNKGLLVPTRLALRRQRASLKPSAMNYEPIRSDTLQMELGNPEESILHSDRVDVEHNPIVSHTLHLSREKFRMQSSSNQSSPLRGDTPHTVPTDIGLLYREKPLFSHPVTGNFIVQYAEEQGGPSPCSYVLPRKSCREKNAPAYSFGAKCLVEKKGGSRTAWEKQWFAHSDPYTTKVDFNRETAWPTPFHYPAKPTLGSQVTKVSFPSWSIAKRIAINPTIMPENNPGPDTYDTISAFRKLKAKNTHIKLTSRPEDIQGSNSATKGKTPGPGAHDQKHFLSNKYSAPKHSFGRRMPTSLAQDPYVNTLPTIET